MIVSDKRQFAYLSPPKTASTSLHGWLSQPALCDRRWSAASGGQHSTAIPPEAKDYFTFASIRNPYDRAVSLWRHSQSGGRANGEWPELSFGAFIERAKLHPSWFYRASQAEILDGIRLDAVVRVERLTADLLALPVLYNVGPLERMPYLNGTKHEPWPSYYGEAEAQAVREWWADDFQRWEYHSQENTKW